MRFLLATILASGLLSAAASQPKAELTAGEKKLFDLVTKAGGTAEVDPRLPEKARVVAKFDTVTARMLYDLKKAPPLGALEVLDMSGCSDQGYEQLKGFPNLRRLTAGKSNLTAPRVASIGQCKELRELFLGGAGLSDAELRGLARLKLLESLDLSDNPGVTDKGMPAVAALERLRTLNLSKTGVTDKGLVQLKKLDGLRTVIVVGTEVTGDGAEQFADEMPNLRGVRR